MRNVALRKYDKGRRKSFNDFQFSAARFRVLVFVGIPNANKVN
jgi:hypothetical protein